MEKRAINAITAGIEEFKPGNFAMVMATGIVSLVSYLHGMKTVSLLLFRLNVAVYIAFCLFTLARYLFFRSRLKEDLTDYARTTGLFTLVAGTCVLGAQFTVMTGDSAYASSLWVAGCILWILISYSFLSLIATRRFKTVIVEKINGEWLLTVVSTQSVVILGALIAPSIPAASKPLLFIALCLYMIGSMLYMIVIAAIIYRMLFIRLAPVDLDPSYWINMGAAAISALAGSTLILESHLWQFLRMLVPFLLGGSLFFWAVGGCWIPPLLILGVWAHLRAPSALHSAYRYWSLVFPLGMYSACSFQLSAAAGLPFLQAVSSFFNYAALLAWAATLLAVLISLIRTCRRLPQKK